MAQIELGNIIIKDTIGAWSAGDLILCYFNDATQAIEVERNTVSISSGETLLLERRKNYGKTYINDEKKWSRTYTYYEYQENGEVHTFIPSQSFPYFTDKIEEAPTEETEYENNEITISLTSVSPASDAVTADGSIVVSSSGGNGTVKYSLEKPDYTYGQTSGTFSNLPAGNYTIYATDDRNYYDDITAFISYSGDQYAPKWRINFTDKYGSDGRVDICERGQVGDPLEVSGSSTPYSYSTRGETSDLPELTIIYGQVDINLINTELDQYISIAHGDDEQFLAKVYHDLGSGLELKWQGYVNPSSFSDEPSSSAYVTSITANDRLAYLNSFYFTSTGDFKKEISFINPIKLFKGYHSMMSAIITCLGFTNIIQGFRIACNIFEINQTQTNTTPLHQTYFNADVYSIDGNPVKCDQVIKEILAEFNAKLLSWDGYWYIVRQKEEIETSVSYKEFDEEGTYVTSSSYNPRIEFKRPTESNKYRWISGMSRVFTETFRNVRMIIDTVVKQHGLINPFESKYIVRNSYGIATRIKGFTYHANNEGFSSIVNNVGSFFNPEYVWSLSMYDIDNSNSYLLWNQNIEHVSGDKFILRLKYTVSVAHSASLASLISFNQYPPYLTMKWRLKLGDLYLTTDGRWVSGSVINEHFITSFEKEDELEIEFNLPNNGSTQIDSCQLRIYPVSIFENHGVLGSRLSLSNFMNNIATVDLPDGTRQVVLVNGSSSDTLYFYELQTTDQAEDSYNLVEPDDFNTSTNPRKWVLVSTFSNADVFRLYTRTTFYKIELDYLPRGEKPAEEIEEIFVNNDKNRIDKDIVVHHFDLTNEISNDEKLFTNYMQRSNGSPTTVWQEVGGGSEKRLAEHRVDWIQKLTKRARMRASGEFMTDVFFTPLHFLYDPDDSSRIYFANGVTCNYKKHIHGGELIEVSSDELPTNSEFDLQAFDQDQFQ